MLSHALQEPNVVRAPFNQNLFYQNALPRAPQEAEGIYTRLLGPQNQQGPGSKVNLLVRWLSTKFWRDLYRADKSTKLCMVVA